MKKLTTNEFINKVKIVHGNKYDLSKTNYVNYDTKITAICCKHGEFKIRPDHFLNGSGCPKCGNEKAFEKTKLGVENFILKAREIHGWKYDYSKVKYKNARTPVCIICPEHGEFWQTPDAHLKIHGCPKCAHRSYKYTTEEFIKRAREIHGDKYDYSKVEYKNRKSAICIICPEHGEFWQKPCNHFKGNGCQECNESHLEEEIKNLLDENKIKYERQKHFDWLKYKYPLSLDFYLPDYGIAIECQGEQHFKDKEFFKKNYNLEKQIKLDILKKKLCEENNIKILYYSSKYFVSTNWDKYNVILSKNKLLKKINEA